MTTNGRPATGHAATAAQPDCAPSRAGTIGSLGRERAVTDVFVAITASLATSYDPIALYGGLAADCTRLLDVAAAGVLLADTGGVLQVMAASSAPARDLQGVQLQCAEGPGLDSYRTGAAVLVPDLAAAGTQWPRFAPAAVAAGFAAVHAIPMRLQRHLLGSLNLFHTRPGPLNGPDLRLAQAFAYAASVVLVVGKAAADKAAVAEQLQTALASRVILEQAKGILSQLGDLPMNDAFAVLRRYARDYNLKLGDVAAAVVSRGLPAGVILEHARCKGIIAC